MNNIISNFHGGNYRNYCKKKGIDWFKVTDYSTSLNWNAQHFYPKNLLYLHYENMEYPDPNYSELYDIISDTYNIDHSYFTLTNGANEAISILFQMLLSNKTFNHKSILLVGPVYSEYTKYTSIYHLNNEYISFFNLLNDSNSINEKIIIIVNPNTPTGKYYNLLDCITNLCNNNNMVILDESFIDFLDVSTCLINLEELPNLFIIRSFTKFYCSAGARLGMIANANKDIINLLNAMTPCWNISAYDNWFYINMIKEYKEIRSSTLLWIKNIHDQISDALVNNNSFKIIDSLNMHYCSIEINPEKIAIPQQGLKDFFLENYNIFVRPIKDFYGFNELSFRVGLRLPEENIPLISAIKDLK